jgi:hypothetical protein
MQFGIKKAGLYYNRMGFVKYIVALELHVRGNLAEIDEAGNYPERR